MDFLIVLSGPVAVGKTSFVDALARLGGARRISTSAYLIKQGTKNERDALQKAGAALDAADKGKWVVKALTSQLKPGDTLIVLDAARIQGQVEALREAFPGKVAHIHLHADDEILSKRYLDRPSDRREFATYDEVKAHPTEAAVPELEKHADFVLDTDFIDPDNLAATALALIGRPLPKGDGLVDVIVGGQYGSEGKGNICAHIAKDYDALMRIGGPNAGHKVFHPKYKFVQLPSGTGNNDDALILIGAGSTLNLAQVLMEIRDKKLTKERLTIDGQAMVIDDQDMRDEDSLEGIGSTRQGVGVASARKILNRSKQIYGPKVRLARDVEQLEEFVGDVRAVLDRLFRGGKKVLLEGTQGTLLSIHHGFYPHVTSRETSVAGCLADAGIAPSRVRKVIMVVRTYPIRVGHGKKDEQGKVGHSGWMGREIEFDVIAERSGLPLDQILNTEKGSVSKKPRRVAEFDWGQIARAAALNGATEIAVTFADYLGAANAEATTKDGLNDDAKAFIGRLEAVTGAKVTFVSKAFAIDGVLEVCK
jgi:adenylosuccinate synthase